MTAPCLWQIVCKVCMCVCARGGSEPLFPFFGAVVVKARPTPASILHSHTPTAQSTAATSLLYLSCNVQSAHKCYFPHAPPLSLRLNILLPVSSRSLGRRHQRGRKDGKGYLCVNNNQGGSRHTWSNCVLLSSCERERQNTMTNYREPRHAIRKLQIIPEKREQGEQI